MTVASSYPLVIPYSQALNYALQCNVGEAFLTQYGSAIQWTDCYIDVGELMAFVDSVLGT